MTSKFDKPDPGLDRDYTDGLAIDPFDTQDIAEEPEVAHCFWCDTILESWEAGPYCSALCANYALTDNCER